MPRSGSASEAKNRLGSIIDWVVEHGDEVIVESRGEPKVVVIPYAEYATLRQVREGLRRREALARLEQLRDKVSARSPDLAAEAAGDLADRFVREVVDALVREGKVGFSG